MLLKLIPLGLFTVECDALRVYILRLLPAVSSYENSAGASLLQLVGTTPVLVIHRLMGSTTFSRSAALTSMVYSTPATVTVVMPSLRPLKVIFVISSRIAFPLRSYK